MTDTLPGPGGDDPSDPARRVRIGRADDRPRGRRLGLRSPARRPVARPDAGHPGRLRRRWPRGPGGHRARGALRHPHRPGHARHGGPRAGPAGAGRTPGDLGDPDDGLRQRGRRHADPPRGAANYIPKRDLARDLPTTLRRVLNVACLTRLRGRILRCLVRRESAFRLESDPALITALLELIREELDGLDFGDPTGRVQISIALQEALANALYHGNLELSSDLRQQDERAFDDLAECRTAQEPYCSRHIRVQVQLDRDAARFVVADDGPGFDTALFDRPVQPDDLTRIGGRGLLLIRTFMDQVSFNSVGNQITMVKYRS